MGGRALGGPAEVDRGCRPQGLVAVLPGHHQQRQGKLREPDQGSPGLPTVDVGHLNKEDGRSWHQQWLED